MIDIVGDYLMLFRKDACIGLSYVNSFVETQF